MKLDQPDRETIVAAFREAESRDHFWTEHHEELRRLYPDQFVVVCGDEVIAAGANLEEMATVMREQTPASGCAWLRFMPSQPLHFAL